MIEDSGGRKDVAVDKSSHVKQQRDGNGMRRISLFIDDCGEQEQNWD
jgi:hypothetical protein